MRKQRPNPQNVPSAGDETVSQQPATRAYPPIPWRAVERDLRGVTPRPHDQQGTQEPPGFERDSWYDPEAIREAQAEDAQNLFPATAIFERLYSYAYQVGDELERAFFNEVHLSEATACWNSQCKISKQGDRVPMVLLSVLQDATIRFRYQEGWDLNFDGVVSLARLTGDQAAASSSFYELTDELDGELADGPDVDVIDAWLRGHGFRPTLLPEDIGIPHAPMLEALLRTATFSKAITRAVYLSRDSSTKIAAKTNVDEEWLLDLINGEPIAVDTEALTRLATYFDVDAELFVSRAAQAIRVFLPPVLGGPSVKGSDR